MKFFQKRYRISNIIVIAILLTFCLACYMYCYLNNYKNSYAQPGSYKCEVSSEQRQQLFNLLKAVNDTLEKLGITFFLCYFSLWGAIRESGPLPWSTDAELCILSSDLLNYDETSVFRAFDRYNLLLEYNSANGEYSVKNSSGTKGSSVVRLILFESDSKLGGMYKRVGWKRRLLPPDCDAHPALQCFPPHLITPPLQKKSFGPLSIPGPREDIDLLKFHYPDSWWKPLKPTC